MQSTRCCTMVLPAGLCAVGWDALEYSVVNGGARVQNVFQRRPYGVCVCVRGRKQKVTILSNYTHLDCKLFPGRQILGDTWQFAAWQPVV